MKKYTEAIKVLSEIVSNYEKWKYDLSKDEFNSVVQPKIDAIKTAIFALDSCTLINEALSKTVDSDCKQNTCTQNKGNKYGVMLGTVGDFGMLCNIKNVSRYTDINLSSFPVKYFRDVDFGSDEYSTKESKQESTDSPCCKHLNVKREEGDSKKYDVPKIELVRTNLCDASYIDYKGRFFSIDDFLECFNIDKSTVEKLNDYYPTEVILGYFLGQLDDSLTNKITWQLSKIYKEE